MSRFFPVCPSFVYAILCLALLWSVVCRATEPVGASASADPTRPGAWSVEVDPLPFVSGGYSVAVGWQTAHLRVSANAFAANLPSFAVQDGWTGRVRAAGALRLQLYPDRRSRGFFGAVQLGPVASRFTSSSGAIADAYQLVLTPSVGYRWFPWDGRLGLYLMPAVGVGLAVGTWTEGSAYPAPTVTAQAALHLGWEL